MPKTIPPAIAASPLNGTRQPELVGSGVRLRPWASEDHPWMLDAFGDAEIEFWRRRSVSTRAEAEALIVDYAEEWQREIRATWAIVASDGEVLGRASLAHMDLDTGEAELGYWVRAAARRRGVAAAAVNTVSTWAFGVGFHRLIIHHSTRNEGSCAVAARAGFTLEGINRSALRHADGWHDMHLHARIHDDRSPETSTDVR